MRSIEKIAPWQGFTLRRDRAPGAISGRRPSNEGATCVARFKLLRAAGKARPGRGGIQSLFTGLGLTVSTGAG